MSCSKSMAPIGWRIPCKSLSSWQTSTSTGLARLRAKKARVKCWNTLITWSRTCKSPGILSACCPSGQISHLLPCRFRMFRLQILALASQSSKPNFRRPSIWPDQYCLSLLQSFARVLLPSKSKAQKRKFVSKNFEESGLIENVVCAGMLLPKPQTHTWQSWNADTVCA